MNKQGEGIRRPRRPPKRNRQFRTGATAAILLVSAVSTTTTAATSPIDPTGEMAAYYMARACAANAAVDRADEASWWMTYGEGRQPNWTPTTQDYRAAAKTAADALETAANDFGSREWPVSLHQSMNQRIEALYGQSYFWRERSETKTVSKSWPKEYPRGGDSADQIRTALGLPPVGEGCPAANTTLRLGPPKGKTYWIRRGINPNGQRPWDGMTVRRSGSRVEVRAIEGFHSSCMAGTLDGFTVSGKFRRFGLSDLRLNLLVKGDSLRRFMKVGNNSGSQTEWKRAAKSDYKKRLKVKTPWFKCTETTTEAPTTKYYKSGWYPGLVAVRFSDQNRNVQAVWQGDGPGFCFVGQLASQDKYTGTEYTFGVGKRRAAYRRNLLEGQRVSPPEWFRQSSKRAFDREECQ